MPARVFFMGVIASAITRALRRNEDLLRVGGEVQVFVWKGVEIPCAPNSKTSQIVIDDELNSISDIKQQLLVRMSNFLTADSTLVTIDSELYTVDNDTPVPISGLPVQFPPGTERIIDSTKVDASRAFVVLSLTETTRA